MVDLYKEKKLQKSRCKLKMAAYVKAWRVLKTCGLKLCEWKYICFHVKLFSKIIVKIYVERPLTSAIIWTKSFLKIKLHNMLTCWIADWGYPCCKQRQSCFPTPTLWYFEVIDSSYPKKHFAQGWLHCNKRKTKKSWKTLIP